jgi:rubrerythrin
MPVHIRVEAAPADRCVYVHLLNLESQPYKRYKFSADKVDGALLERLAKLLVREESKLIEVEVSDDMRSELRRRLEIENRRREEELARAYAEMEAEKSAEREAKFTFRLTRAIQHKTGLAMNYMKSRMAEADSRLKKYNKLTGQDTSSCKTTGSPSTVRRGEGLAKTDHPGNDHD